MSHHTKSPSGNVNLQGPGSTFGHKLRWNQFLSSTMRHLRQSRPLATPEEYGWYTEQTAYAGRPYELPLAWFVTNGCFADRAGSCTMCNFGAGVDIDKDKLLWQFEKILDRVAGLPMVYITPLGSMFDDMEVPPDIRRLLFQRLSSQGCRIYGTETRADTITDEKMAEFRDIFGSRVTLQVGLGLETCDPYIQRNCINKGLLQNHTADALSILRKYNIQPLIHVLLKPPFLTEAEAITDASRTVEWAFDHGARGIVFCMTNLKPHTLASWLRERDRYRVPYVWSGLSVLRSMKPEYRRRCTVSGLYSGVTIFQTAYNCPHCTDQMIAGLQHFSNTLDSAILDKLADEPCSCRTEWERVLEQETKSLPQRLPGEYEYIGREMFGDNWWEEAQEWVLHDLESSSSLWKDTRSRQT